MRDLSEDYTFTLGQDSNTDSDAGSDKGEMDYCETSTAFEMNGKNENENILPRDKLKYIEQSSTLINTPANVAGQLLRDCIQNVPSSESST